MARPLGRLRSAVRRIRPPLVPNCAAAGLASQPRGACPASAGPCSLLVRTVGPLRGLRLPIGCRLLSALLFVRLLHLVLPPLPFPRPLVTLLLGEGISLLAAVEQIAVGILRRLRLIPRVILVVQHGVLAALACLRRWLQANARLHCRWLQANALLHRRRLILDLGRTTRHQNRRQCLLEVIPFLLVIGVVFVFVIVVVVGLRAIVIKNILKGLVKLCSVHLVGPPLKE